MFSALARKFFGTRNTRYLKRLNPIVQKINDLEEGLKTLDDAALRGQTVLFRQRLADGETLDDLLPEAFATVREASRRVTGMRHFDVQLVGGMVLHHGKITEMGTGEGKTLVATLPLYLNALEGKGAHLVTVNDYLAKRDSEWMGQIYQFLGLTVGVIVHGQDDVQRQAAYQADITYGTNNEFGFDFLRDNMKFTLEEMVQRPLHYAIVDEVDSILIDEARTPLIISGPTEDNTDKYYTINAIIPLLERDVHYTVDEKARTVVLTEEGNEHGEKLLRERGLLEDGDLYDVRNVEKVHHLNQALKAHALFEHDKDYIVKEGEVVIIDEFTGRMMPGRRYSDGLHQALEAKEQVVIQNESQTLASITFQNLFRMYDTLSGMTGTADTEATEFESIYDLEVIIIPSNQDLVRVDNDDEVYRTHAEKVNAILTDVQDCYKRGQPTLVGTVSIEKSEELAKALKKLKIPHKVLNAKFHEMEAEIVSQAGRKDAVTIATNMAGRGTDIQLGGNVEMRIKAEVPEGLDEAEKQQRIAAIRAETNAERRAVLAAGGLHIIGTERHESRRIDNQLRGRAGRQGDPGSSRFFLSLQDDLMRIFGSDRMDGMLQKLGLEEGEAIVHPWINKAIESAQKKVEGRNFDIRKNILKFDDVMNDQRMAIYEQRRQLMESEDISEYLAECRNELFTDILEQYIPEEAYPEEWQTKEFVDSIMKQFAISLPADEWKEEEGVTALVVKERSLAAIDAYLKSREERLTPPLMRYLEKSIMLQMLDFLWKEHLLNMDHLREGIHLRGYAQKDPLNEYKQEAFSLFAGLLDRIKVDTVEFLSRVEVQQQEQVEAAEAERAQARERGMTMNNPKGDDEEPSGTPFKRSEKKVGRNAPCTCGSGRKFKHCCGRIT
ncbi:MAG: preprotein translocase subunit SecA [Magnetococcales bacterium]|nr:preprotein translocase subunit SecA [Magnetococcales bacterium]